MERHARLLDGSSSPRTRTHTHTEVTDMQGCRSDSWTIVCLAATSEMTNTKGCRAEQRTKCHRMHLYGPTHYTLSPSIHPSVHPSGSLHELVYGVYQKVVEEDVSLPTDHLAVAPAVVAVGRADWVSLSPVVGDGRQPHVEQVFGDLLVRPVGRTWARLGPDLVDEVSVEVPGRPLSVKPQGEDVVVVDQAEAPTTSGVFILLR
mmetsp:Transcript_18571/g.53067  ORF Transcript_18571/g.53067 Transcript_18571/m.53067 type:complete len:204 (-) Transcript_18571:752-1363(-)